jgi:hypothetical protein
MHGGSSVFLAMLQKVLPRCVVAGPRGTQERASPGWAFPRGLRVWRGALANARTRANWLGLPHPSGMIRCRMRTITLRDAKTTKVAF